jgi:diamine N-acetyltransferase
VTHDADRIGRHSTVSLRQVTIQTLGAICDLSDTLDEAQSRMVAENVHSIAEAYFSRHAWFRAIYADETPVGFVMLHIGTSPGESIQIPGYFLWRLMIAAPYQGLGFGRRTLELVFDKIRTEGGTELTTSCFPGEGSAMGFYRKLGFEPDGTMHGGEVGLSRTL